MIQPQSKLTVVLKIYAVFALLYAIYVCISTIIAYMDASIPLILISMMSSFFTVVVNCLLVVIIYRNKNAPALFLPCLLSGIVLFLYPFALIAMSILTTTVADIGVMAFWQIIGAIIFLLIAVDSKSGSKYAFAELIALAAFEVFNTVGGFISVFFALGGFARLSKGMIITYMSTILLRDTLDLVFSSAVVIILFLCRIHSWRKMPTVPAVLTDQAPED